MAARSPLLARDPRFFPIPIGFIRGLGYDITDADDAFLAMVGYSRADLDGGRMSWREMTPAEFLHLDEAGMRQAHESGGFTAPYVKEFYRKGGGRVRVLLVCAFVPDREGEWCGYVVDLAGGSHAVARAEDMTIPLEKALPLDMTARLVGELVRERARMLQMLDSTPAIIWAVDRNVRLLGANAAFMATQKQASGQDVDVGDDMLADRFPDAGLRDWASLYRRALSGEHFSTTRSYALGSRVAHFEYHLSPIVGPTGDVAGATIVSIDQTTRFEMEARLRASEARFRSLALSLPVGVFVVDVAGRLTMTNPRLREIMGAADESLLGHAYLDLVLPEHRASLEHTFATARERGLPFEIAFEIRRPDGQVRSVRCQAQRAEEQDARSAFVGTIEDETERLARAQRAQQGEKMESLGTLAGGIAHDFNNMLSVVLGFAEVGARPDATPADQAEAFEAIQTASFRARDLVQRILAFSRRTERRLETVDLQALVVESARLLRAAIPASVAIDLDLPSTPVLVRGEQAALQQVLLNLCSNAEHALRAVADARITIRLGTDVRGGRPCARLEIRDNGHGIPREVAARVFEPFFTTKPPGEGTGMGLAMVHGIVSSHEGEVTAESAPGAGATFVVAIPLTQSQTAESEQPAATVPPAQGGRILLVEDEESVRRFAARVLAKAGYTVDAVSSAHAALDRLRGGEVAVDLVLTDLTMPGMPGDELARELARSHARVPCILMSGYGSRFRVEDVGGASSGRAFVQKPFTGSELLRAVASLLSLRASSS